MKAPWFPFYCGDFLASSDVQLMEAHEVGAYVLLLAHSWQSDMPGYLPNDEGRLRRLARLSVEAWKDCAALLLSKWPVAELNATLRYNPRLKKEAEKQLEMRELKAEAGRKSAERRAKLATERQQTGNTNPTGVEITETDDGKNGNYSQSQSQSQSQEGKPSCSSFQSEQTRAPEVEEVEHPAENSEREAPHTRGGATDVGTGVEHTTALKVQRGGQPLEPDGFAQIYEAWPKKVSRQDAAKAFARLIEADRLAALGRVRAWLATCPDVGRENNRFLPNLATWLNGKRWTDARPDPIQQPDNPQQHAVHNRSYHQLGPAARAAHVPNVTSYGSLD